MGTSDETFSLPATIAAVQQALVAIFCHMFFKFALHGLLIASLLGLVGLILRNRKNQFGKPLLNVSRRAAIFCSILSLPGFLYWLVFHALPDAGVFNFNSIGFICLWSLIYLHLCAEEIYYQQSQHGIK